MAAVEAFLAQKALPREQGGGLNKGKRLVGRNVGGSLKDPPKDQTPTLTELGIGKGMADRARKLAAVPERSFEGRRP